MYKSGGSYSRRAVEADIIRYIDDVLADPDTSFSVALLVGSRLHGIRALLVQGVVARLRERDPDQAPTQCRGEWARSGAIQFCVAEAEVPPAPPPPGAEVRILVIACFDLDSLPTWLSAADGPHVRMLPVGPLSLIEAHEFLESRLGDPIDPQAAHTLATLAGHLPQALAVIADECRSTGALEKIDGVWVVLGDPLQIAILPYLRAQMVAAGDHTARCVTHLAVIEPLSTEHLPPAVLESATALLADDEMRRRDDGLLEFTAPASGEGLRRIASADLRDRLFEDLLRTGAPTIHALRWAASSGRAVTSRQLEAVALTALSAGDWRAVVELADLSDEPGEAATTGAGGGPGEPGSRGDVSGTGLTWCRLRLHAATALRLSGDPLRAHAFLDEVEAAISTAAAAGSTEAADVRTAARLIRADLLHFSDGDPGAALELLEGERGAGEHTFIHRVYAGRIRDAALTTDSGPFPGGPTGVRDRVTAARLLLHTAAGTPRRALRDELHGTAPWPAADATDGEQPRWVRDELDLARTVTTSAAAGPATPGPRHRQVGVGAPGPHPDIAQAWYLRAEHLYACGEIERAHRHAGIALESAAFLDPVGFERAIRSLLAETSVLLGDRPRAVAALDRCATIPARATAAIAGPVHAHLAAARIALTAPDAGEELRRTAAAFADAGAFGFASDILYAGVRLGRRRAAADLSALSDVLDGAVHQLRLRHASALLSRDAVELLVVVDDLRHSGFHLYAAEAAATAASLPSAPTSVRQRATRFVATHLADRPLPGHPLLSTIAGVGATQLTPRESEVASLIDTGLSNAEIAERLSLTLSTVEGHITRIYRKTGGTRRAPARR